MPGDSNTRILGAILAFCLASSSMVAVAAAQDAPAATEEKRPRVRELGLSPGILSPGPWNAITDVEGVRVGHQTLISNGTEGGNGKEDEPVIRTGVTAILPHGGDIFREPVPAAVWVGNGFGKAAGFLQVQELGELESPIVLTNTLSVGRAVEAVVSWTISQPGHEQVRSVNAVVGETNDGYLNDIRGMHVSSEDVIAAIETASSGRVAEGNVGAGTGTRAFSFKGGIGTASRKLPATLGGFTVGALVQTNFDGVLQIDGVPVGEILGRYAYRNHVSTAEEKKLSEEASASRFFESADGSCMIVLATDAPILARNLERLAKRGILGLARTGGFMSNGSGDFVIAFSTYQGQGEDSSNDKKFEILDNSAVSPLFLAAVEAVEEAIYNSLLQAATTSGPDGRRVEAISIDRLRDIFSNHRR